MASNADRRRYLLWRSLGTVLEQLPVGFAVKVAEAVGWTIGARRGPARSIAEANLRQLVEHGSDEPIDQAVLDRWVRRYVASYARYWAEGATLPGLTPGGLHQAIELVEGREELDRAMALGRGAIVALPHVGSWEWGGGFLARIGHPMLAVAEELEPPELFEWFIAKREAIGLQITPLDRNAGKVLLSTLSDGGLVGLLCDRDITGDGIEVELLGRRAKVPAGPATLALRTGAPLLPGVVYSGPGGDHCAHILPPLDTERRGRLREDVTRVTQALSDEMSGLIRRRPEQWHVFSDPFVDGTGQ